MGFSFLGTVGWIVLAAVLAALAFMLRRASPGQRGMRVVARLALEPRRNLHVVEIAGRVLVLSSSESGVAMLTELDPAAAAQLEVADSAASSFLAGLFATERGA